MLEQEFNTHNIGDCVLMKCLLFLPILFWKVGENDGKKKKTQLLFWAWVFLRGIPQSGMRYTFGFLIYIFSLCNKIMNINVEFQTIETTVVCATGKRCYNRVEPGCDPCHSFVPHTCSCPVSQLDFSFLLTTCTSVMHALSTWPWNTAWRTPNSGADILVATQITF